MGGLSKKKSSLGPIKQISKSLFENVKFDKFPLILLHKKIVFLFKTLCQTTCMIYHMNLYIVCYISSPQKCQNLKFIFSLFMDKWIPKQPQCIVLEGNLKTIRFCLFNQDSMIWKIMLHIFSNRTNSKQEKIRIPCLPEKTLYLNDCGKE